MSDYISREAAIEKIRVAAGCTECDGSSSALCVCNICDFYNAIRLIMSLPAADVAPVRSCKWVRTDYDWHSLTTYRCTACGEEFCFEIDEDLPLLNYNYCPNCGAKMDLEDESHEGL